MEVKPLLTNCALVKRTLTYKGICKIKIQTMESNETTISLQLAGCLVESNCLFKRKKVTNFKLFLKL